MVTKILYFSKNILYLIFTLIVGGMLINGEPIAFFIFGLWLNILAIAFFKKWPLIIRLFLPDSRRFFESCNDTSYKKAFWVSLLSGIFLFVLGFVELVY